MQFLSNLCIITILLVPTYFYTIHSIAYSMDEEYRNSEDLITSNHIRLYIYEYQKKTTMQCWITRSNLRTSFRKMEY
jgi:hypothetical protein